MRKWRISIILLALLAVIAAAALWYRSSQAPASNLVAVRYGITPFQDSALPVVANELGWYKQDGLNVSLVNLGWSDVPLALASNSVDVAVYNFDSYMAASEQLEKGGAKVVFYAPFYVWNGAAIMVRGDRGFAPAGDLSKMSAEERKQAVTKAVEQLRGKRVGVTQGTTFEQTVLDALRLAGMNPRKDVRLISARPEDNLAAFLAGDLDAFSAGLTERIQAKRHGGTELIIGPDVSLPAIDGLVARKAFVDQHPDVMRKLVDNWFKTIRYMKEDVPGHSKVIRDYLRGKASVDYSPEEYAIAWNFQHFPASRGAARTDFLTPGGIYYWQPIWQSNSAALLAQNKLTGPVPESLFLGQSTLAEK